MTDLTRTASTSAQALAMELGITDTAKKAKVYDHILALLTLERERDKWQALDSIPKDGRFVQVWVPALHEQGFIGRIDAYWDAENNELAGVHSNALDDCEASHWQPLPSPPGASE